MERVQKMVIKTVKFDLSTNKMIAFVDDGSAIRKIEIKTTNRSNDGLPLNDWADLAVAEAVYQQQQALLASRGMLIPGYNS